MKNLLSHKTLFLVLITALLAAACSSNGPSSSNTITPIAATAVINTEVASRTEPVASESADNEDGSEVLTQTESQMKPQFLNAYADW